MKAGKLRHRVVLERPIQVQDPVTGAVTIQWEFFRTVWAAVEPLSVREFLAAQQTHSEVTARITLRYSSGFKPEMRIVHRGLYYNPAGFLPDPKSGLDYVTVPCSQGLSDGQ